MRAKEFINEVFDSDVPGHLVRSTPDLYTTKAIIGGRTIVFNAAQYDDADGKSVWEIGFIEHEKNGTGTTFGKTGSGAELRVFSFVIESAKDLISRYHPDQLTFTSHRADGNRTKLYKRILNRVKVPGYHAAPIEAGKYDDYFKIVKDNVTESYQPPELNVGDKILKGKFKNSPAEIKGFTKDKHNQPVLKTNKGNIQLFKPRITKLMKEEETPPIKLSNNDAAKAWIEKVYAKYPHTMQNNHVMVWGSGDDQQFAMFELTPSMSKRGAVEVKWFQAYPLRQGVGSRAMKELQALAREDSISLTLFPWDKGQVSQTKLTKFYKGQGFTPTVKGGKAMKWDPETLEESFNTHQPYEIILDYPDTFRTKFKTSAGLEYTVNIGDGVTVEEETADILYGLARTDEQYEQIGEMNGLAFIMFDQDGNQGITGTGNATEVISTVLAILGYYWDNHHPKMFAFHSKEPSRTRLYLHIASKIPGFRFVAKDKGHYLFSSI